MTTKTTTTPQVWVGCLAAYNDGELHGDWVDAVDADDLRESIEEILKTSPIPNAEEFHFCDFEGFGEATSHLGRYSSVDEVCGAGALIEEHGDRAIAWMSEPYNFANPEGFDDASVQEIEDAKSFAMDFADEMGVSLDDDSFLVIDWEATGDQLLMDYFQADVNGSTFIWRSV